MKLLTVALLLGTSLIMKAQLRTDGFSKWVQTKVGNDIRSISGWFALESFPTDTAAFISICDQQGQHVGICVDRFGQLMLGTNEGYSVLPQRVERFCWLHFLLDLEDHIILMNGRRIPCPAWADLNCTDSLILLAGKDFTVRRGWGYNLNVINGLIDGVKGNCEPSEVVLLRDNVGQRMNEKPSLAIEKERFAHDFNRPKYHLMPAANWTNETHGLLLYKGRWHLFNQKNASNILLRQINWGHFSSQNLIDWTEQRPALTPGAPYDSDGIWSGHAVINDAGIPQIIYTGGGSQTTICTAFPMDSLLVNWHKYEENPIVTRQPQPFTRTDMRDPYIFNDDGLWYMIIGFGIDRPDGSHGALLLYRSTDLKRWEYVHLLFEGNPRKDHTGRFWEMPVFKRFDRKWILLVNRVPEPGAPARTQYWIGNFEHEKFIPDNPLPQNLEVINRLLSPSVSDMPDGRIIAMAIIPDEIDPAENRRQGWAHVYSIPREWRFNGKKICQRPYKGLCQLRSNHESYPMQAVSTPLVVSRQGRQKEIVVRFNVLDGADFGITLCKDPAGSEWTRITFDQYRHQLRIDQKRVSGYSKVSYPIQKEHFRVNRKKTLQLRLLIDGSVVEGFINDEDAFTTRCFMTSKYSTQVEIFTKGPRTQASTEVYDLRPASMKTNF